MSFTQALRAQGLTESNTKTEAAQTETKPKTEQTKKQPEPKVEETKQEPANKKSAQKDDGEVKTFIDLIRSEGLL